MNLICLALGHAWIIPQDRHMFRPIVCERCEKPLLNSDGIPGYGGWIPPRQTKH